MKLRFGVVLASAFALATGACAAGTGGPASPRPASVGGELLEQGEQPVPNNQTRQAENRLGLAMVASGEQALEHYQAALQQAQIAIRNDERNPLPWLLAGRAYLGLRQYAEADSVFRRAEELRPVYRLNIDEYREQTWARIYNEGAELLREGRYAEAVPIYEQANLVYDKRPEVILLLGQLYQQLGDHEKSIDMLKRALAIIDSPRINEVDSATAELWREQREDIPPALAQAFVVTQRFQEAVATIRPMLDADPTNQAYARSLATIFINMGQADSARAVYDRLERAIGNLSPSDYYVIALGAYQVEDWNAAERGFESVLRAWPRDRDAAEWRARALVELWREQEASGSIDAEVSRKLLEAAERWLELDPYSYHAHLIVAQQLQKANEGDPRISQLIEKLDALPLFMENLEFQKSRNGGGTFWADVRNNSETSAGRTVTIRITFYGESGQSLGTHEGTVRLPAKDASEVFQVDFDSDQQVAGYTYEVQM